MTLHCSLEHFEGEEDTAFIQEASRVLAKGGRLVIVPLYLSDQYFVVTQPSLWATLPKEEWPVFPVDAIIFGSKTSGNRHERYYDAKHFIERLVLKTDMEVHIHSFSDSRFYTPGSMRFAAAFHKLA